MEDIRGLVNYLRTFGRGDQEAVDGIAARYGFTPEQVKIVWSTIKKELENTPSLREGENKEIK